MRSDKVTRRQGDKATRRQGDRVKFILTLSLCHLVTLSPCLAQGPSPPAPIPQFVVHTVDGLLPAGPLLQLSEDLALRIGGNDPKVVPAGNFVALRHASGSRPDFLNRNVLLLSNGDRLPVDVDATQSWRLDQDRVFFHPAAPLHCAAELNVSVNHVSALVLGDADTPEERELFLARLIEEARSRDVVWLTNGDRVEGVLKALDSAQGAILEVNGQKDVIPLARIGAVAFNTEFKAKPRVKGPYGQVVLAGGARFGLVQLRLDAGKGVLFGKTLFGAALDVPLSEIRAIDVRQGPAMYLSDLAAQSFQHKPFLNVSWPLAKDASVVGRPIRLGKDTFDKGLGMHTQSRATYKLEAKYRWFEAVVGLDDRTGRLGRYRVKVLVDGKEQDLKAGPARSWNDEPLTIRLDVRQAQELILAVEFADFGDVQGHVNWGDARLIK